MNYQPPLPPEYQSLEPKEACERIARHKARFGRELCILAHHYQRDEVFRFGDFTGDSLKLSQQAAATEARFIVFCGVHFMAESADILSPPGRVVILPDLAAGCAMAEMAETGDVEEALAHVQAAAGAGVVPVTYVNSSAAIKALTGRAGGACCTSSNARSVFEWALSPTERGGAGGQKILAIPDQHLGVNTAVAMGYSVDDCALYDPKAEHGGLNDDQIRRAKFILWKGQCYVHQRFTTDQIARVRTARPGIKVIVHPECPRPVVAAADYSGSTEQILHAVNAAPSGSSWAIGTETNMVLRLAANNPGKYIRTLADTPPFCVMMARIDLAHLLWSLDNLAAGRVVNQVSVPATIAADARLALKRMLDLKPATGLTPK